MNNETNKPNRHFAEDHVYEGNKSKPYVNIIAYLIFGLFFIVAGIIQFIKLKNWELKGGVMEMNTGTELMYKLGGKWFILAFMVILGAVIARKGYMTWRRTKTYKQL
jgi:hypothetical protein